MEKKDYWGNPLGKLTNVACSVCGTMMYNTANGLWWYCPNCQELTDRGHKILEK